MTEVKIRLQLKINCNTNKNAVQIRLQYISDCSTNKTAAYIRLKVHIRLQYKLESLTKQKKGEKNKINDKQKKL